MAPNLSTSQNILQILIVLMGPFVEKINLVHNFYLNGQTSKISCPVFVKDGVLFRLCSVWHSLSTSAVVKIDAYCCVSGTSRYTN